MKKIFFTCFTPYQLLNCMYYSFKLKDCYKILIWQDYSNYGIDFELIKPYFNEIHFIPFALDGGLLKKQIARSVNAGYLFAFTKIKKMLSKAKNSVMMLFSDQECCTYKQLSAFMKNSKRRNNHAILVEEGLGVYEDTRLYLSKRGKLAYKLAGMKYLPYIGASNKYSAVCLKSPEMLSNGKFKDKPIIKQNNMLLDKAFIDSLPFVLKLNDGNNLDKKFVLFLGTPCYEAGMTNEEYVNLLNDVVKTFSSQYKIIYKPHPREDVSFFKEVKGIELWQEKKLFWVPAEILALKLNPIILITLVSSAATNIYELMPNLKMILLYKLVNEKIVSESMTESYEKLKNCYLPKTIEELSKMIESPIDFREIESENQDEDLDVIKSFTNN